MTTTAAKPEKTQATSSPMKRWGPALEGASATYLRRPMVWWIALIWLFQVVVFAYLVNAMVYQSSPDDPMMSSVVANLRGEAAPIWPLASMPMYGAPVFILLGVLGSGLDYRNGTLRMVMPRYGHRTTFLMAKWGCLVLLSIVLSVLTVAVSLAASFALTGVTDQEFLFPALTDILSGVAVGALVILTLGSVGFMLAVLTESVLGGFLIGLGWTLGIEILLLSMLSPLADWVDTLRGFLPTGAAGSLVASLAEGRDVELETSMGVSSLIDMPGPLISLVVWILLSLVVSLVVFRRRDLR